MDGISVLINRLSGRDPWDAIRPYVGQEVRALALADDRLTLTFDGGKVALHDDGQSCCESRYMRTDDDLGSVVGGRLLDILVKDGPTAKEEYGDQHEQQFLEVKTDKGSVVLSSHVEHNGYYGGFDVVSVPA